MPSNGEVSPSRPYLRDGTVYSRRKDFCPFSAPPLEDYIPIVGEERVERLDRIARKLKGLKILELNSSAQGGGVAEMLYSSVPFLNNLGIEDEWKVVRGSRDYFVVTKTLHNLLQGIEGTLTPEMERIYFSTLEENAASCLIDYSPDVVMVHDPQPLGLTRYLKKEGEAWLWRCHIDIDEDALRKRPRLWDFISLWAKDYDAAIFSAAHYVISRWPLPKFIIPPFIDPLSPKNRELSQEEIDRVLKKYRIDPGIPIISQIGRFDPWKGLMRTIRTFRIVRGEVKSQLILVGSLAADDPEGERVLAELYQETARDEDIHILLLSMENRIENWLVVNAIQRASSVIMQPSIKEGFGLVITEALWKGKPVIASDVGGIPLQVREGCTGYFYESPERTAERVVYLLRKPEVARQMGERGRQYVAEHFLLPDRLADYLMAIDLVINVMADGGIPRECIVSFHPWFKLSRRVWE
jgi:trehalose synthase